ncbi:MAG: hypothetical protein WA705_29605 [Candidatus Ozemobacteraceae bacterium]
MRLEIFFQRGAVRRAAFFTLFQTTFILFLLFVIPSAFAQTQDASGTHHSKASGHPAIVSGYMIPVFSKGVQVASLSLDHLKGLPAIEVTTPETKKNQSGPTLLAVLESIGVKDFSEVIISGYSKGRISTAEMTLKKNQVNKLLIFDFTNRGTVKLVSPEIPFNDWIVDIDKVEAK